MVSFSVEEPSTVNSSSCSNEKEEVIVFKETGFIGSLTDEQIEILKKLKQNIEDNYFTHLSPECYIDTFLLRFLRARSFNLEKASKMLQESLNWRKFIQIDELINEDFPFEHILKERYPRTYHGIDKLGRPVFINCIGKLRIKDLINNIGKLQLIRKYIQEYEFCSKIILPSCSIKAGRSIEQTFNILDLNGLNFSLFDSKSRSFLRDILALGQNHYPDMLGDMIIINTPKIFKIIWAFAKPFLDERTITKIKIFGYSDDWKSYLQTVIDKNEFPAIFEENSFLDNSFFCNTLGPWTDLSVLKKLKEKTFYSKGLFKISFPNLSLSEFDELYDSKINNL